MNTQLTTFGGRDEIKELGFRLQKMMPSAQNFTADEALAVAQIAHAHSLDPFNGEVWGIKNYDGKWYGVMVGIKGLRKCARREASKENSSYWLDFVPVEAKKYHVTQEGAIVYECYLRDSANMQAYGQAVHNLVDAGIPYKEALEMVGPSPVTIGIGIAWPAEKSKMALHQRAKKRSEADALKTRYDVDFGSATLTIEEPGDIIEGEAENLPDDFDMGVESEYPKRSELQNMSELGWDADEPPIKQSKTTPHPDSDPTRMVSVLSADVVSTVVNDDTFENEKAAAAVLSKFKPAKAPFRAIVEKAHLYREWKTELKKDEEETVATDKAIAHANNGDQL